MRGCGCSYNVCIVFLFGLVRKYYKLDIRKNFRYETDLNVWFYFNCLRCKFYMVFLFLLKRKMSFYII